MPRTFSFYKLTFKPGYMHHKFYKTYKLKTEVGYYVKISD